MRSGRQGGRSTSGVGGRKFSGEYCVDSRERSRPYMRTGQVRRRGGGGGELPPMVWTFFFFCLSAQSRTVMMIVPYPIMVIILPPHFSVGCVGIPPPPSTPLSASFRAGAVLSEIFGHFVPPPPQANTLAPPMGQGKIVLFVCLS